MNKYIVTFVHTYANSTGLRLVVNGINRGKVPYVIELPEGNNTLRLENKTFGFVLQSTEIQLQLYSNVNIIIDFSGFFLPTIKCNVVPIDTSLQMPSYQTQPTAVTPSSATSFVTPSMPSSETPSQEQMRAGDVCPKCKRRNYMASDDQCASFCKWCGVVFDKNGVVKMDNYGFECHHKPKNYFRNVWDASNVVKIDTTQLELNHKFLSYIFNNFSDCKIESRVAVQSFNPSAPDYCMPINFMVSKGEKKVAVLLVERRKTGRYSLLETNEQCKEHNISPIWFFIEMPNEEEYVVTQIRKHLE
ncbi:MAG: hypothetical protein IJW42_07620 [Alistipes sp.]|nr:hypothetical protein [Alistipes sp.]MBQ7343105.1 hypothetical protein [Alistipes sp.]